MNGFHGGGGSCGVCFGDPAGWSEVILTAWALPPHDDDSGVEIEERSEGFESEEECPLSRAGAVDHDGSRTARSLCATASGCPGYPDSGPVKPP